MIRFNPHGMSEEELISLSKDYPFKSLGCMEPEFYGLGKEIRHYGFYPQSLPIFLSSEHGICLWDYPQNFCLNTAYPYMLVHSRRMKTAWEERSKIPCFVMKSPFVMHRRRNRITQSTEAKGTLAFFGHSTKEIDIEIDIDKYIYQLSNLPPIYHPVSVCLHFIDIQKGFHKRFLEKSIPVYTAGHWLDPEFIGRFYLILSRFKFAISNMIGSYAFYAVEMGIPFSLYGEMPKYFNRADTSLPLGHHDFKVHKQFALVSRIFEGIHSDITPEQKAIVETELGINDGISRPKMSFVLYGSVVRFLFSAPLLKYLAMQGYKYLPDIVKGKFYLLRNNLIKEAKIYSHLETDEKKYLHKLARGLNPGANAVEIGSYLGASSCLIANGMSKTKGTLYCIDTWENQTMPEGERDTFSEFCSNTSKYKDVIMPLRGRSSEVVARLKERIDKIDLLFIDGDHSYEACMADWENYSPFLRKGSVIVFHDTAWAEGVNKVIAWSVTKVADRILKLPNMQAFKINGLCE